MKRLIVFLMLCLGLNAFAFDPIGLGVSVVDSVKNGGKLKPAYKQQYEKELEKEEKERIAKADRQMQLCLEILYIENQFETESEMRAEVAKNKELSDYVELLKRDEKEKQRCLNRQEREILIANQEYEAYQKEVSETSCLYHFLEM